VADALVLAVIALFVFLISFTFANVGLGGGGLYVPVLLLLWDPVKTLPDAEDLIVPVSLALAAATAISSTWNHARKGFVDLKIGKNLVLGALLGAVVGTTFTLDVLVAATFKVFFASLLFVLACLLMYDWYVGRKVDQDDDSKMTPRRMSLSSIATAASGFVSGSAGVGGGIFNVPIMTYGLGRNTRTATGTSSLIIIPTAIFGFLIFVLRHGGVPAEFSIIPILFPLALVGAFVGSRWGLQALRARSVALLFIGVVFFADALVILEVLGVL
jgi:hypothetical protein